jgi:Family of unknown function (DUF6530)
MNVPDPGSLKHRPIFLVPYEAFDGPYAGNSDCKFISIGWAQWDENPRPLSVKLLRHTGERWSRQSEEVPLHRCIDAAAVIATAVEQSNHLKTFDIPAGFFEGQTKPIPIEVGGEGAHAATKGEQEHLRRQLQSKTLRRRLTKLTEVLLKLRRQGLID